MIATSCELIADRSMSMELDDDSGQITRVTGPTNQAKALIPGRSAVSPPGIAPATPLVFSITGGTPWLPIRITRHARSVSQQTVLSAQISRGLVDLVQDTTFVVRHGALSSLEIRVPDAVGDRWEVLDREVVDREDLPRGPDGSRRYRLMFDRPVLDKATLRFHLKVAITPHLDAAEFRGVTIPWITLEGALAGHSRLDISTAPGIVVQGNDSGWVRTTGDGQPDRGGDSSSTLSFTETSGRAGDPFNCKALALEPVDLPTLIAPRLLIRSVEGLDGTIRSRARYWVETHGPVFPFSLPEGARWIAARVDGRVTDQVDFDSTRSAYRLRFPSDVGSRPVVVELEYQISHVASGSGWLPPEVLDGGIVLDTLWEVNLPWDRAIVGVPPGWSDENEWYWTGRIWKRRTWKDGATLDRWLAGAGTASPGDELREAGLDDSHHLLFSRAGQPAALHLWILSRTWIVVACSGVTLVLGFLAIFSGIRSRTAWAVAAGLAVLAAAYLHPSVTLMILQSSFIGAALTLLALVIERLMDRRRPAAMRGRESGLSAGKLPADSSLERPATVGSDDSTAIRVRVSSTMDFVPSPIAGSLVEESARSSAIVRE